MTELSVMDIIGDPRQLDADLQEFRKNAGLLSSRKAHLIKRYPKRWIAIFGRKVLAEGDSLAQVLAKIDELHVPRGRVVTRYIDRNQRRMIL